MVIPKHIGTSNKMAKVKLSVLNCVAFFAGVWIRLNGLFHTFFIRIQSLTSKIT